MPEDQEGKGDSNEGADRNSFMTGDKLINQIKNLDFLQQMIEKEIII